MAATYPPSSVPAPHADPDRDDRPRRAGAARAGGRRRSGRRSGLGASSTAEWITLLFSASIVLALVGLVTYFHLTTPATPAAVEVEPRTEVAYQSGARYYLPITVRNTGGSTGEDVRVRAVLVDRAGQSETSEVLIPFLAGGGSTRAVVAFAGDPRQGEVSAAVVSYLEP